MTTTEYASTLVSSADVDGTNVYGNDGSKVGHIDHVMIDKKSGKVAYAVMHFGGFLGLGEEQHPVPWESLKYDISKEGYVTGITEDQLQSAPTREANWQHNRDWEQRVHDHYAMRYYWI
jgi:sporulation protein YlmC with PRC-barrel domain